MNPTISVCDENVWKNNTPSSVYSYKPLHVCVCVYLNSSVQRRTGKLVVVFGVDDNLHDVVSVALKHLTTGPLPVPVPQLDQHVIWKHTHRKHDDECSQYAIIFWVKLGELEV